MFVKRALVTIILLPIGILAIRLGGWYFAAVVAIFMVGAAWEYGRLFRLGGLKPADVLIIAGALLLLVTRALDGFKNAPAWLSLLILASLTYHLVAYERGASQSGTEFGVTLGGIFYLGWVGAYLISLRSLPDGKWWVFLVLPAVWFADIAAYLVGSRFGKHKMTPRLSPKKSWEGYFGGVIFGTLLTVVLAAGLQALAGPSSAVTPLRGLWVGLLMSILPTLGDLGESMFKRQVGAKDSSNLIPGHGGFFDRVDSWLWAGVLGYYLITWLWL
jgi:phosphatidate cytidylyltransferase